LSCQLTKVCAGKNCAKLFHGHAQIVTAKP
jgi:hypothetical protein